MSFIPKAKLWIPVRRNAEPIDLTSNNGNELWSTRRAIAQRIQPGDTMILWPSDSNDSYDPAAGPQWPVKEVFWDADGVMQLELALVILNPSDEVRSAYSSRARHGWDVEMFNSKRLWSEDEPGQFDQGMHRGGWRQ